MKLMGGTGRGSCMVNTIWGVFGSARPLPSLSRITGTVIVKGFVSGPTIGNALRHWHPGQ